MLAIRGRIRRSRTRGTSAQEAGRPADLTRRSVPSNPFRVYAVGAGGSGSGGPPSLRVMVLPAKRGQDISGWAEAVGGNGQGGGAPGLEHQARYLKALPLEVQAVSDRLAEQLTDRVGDEDVAVRRKVFPELRSRLCNVTERNVSGGRRQAAGARLTLTGSPSTSMVSSMNSSSPTCTPYPLTCACQSSSTSS